MNPNMPMAPPFPQPMSAMSVLPSTQFYNNGWNPNLPSLIPNDGSHSPLPNNSMNIGDGMYELDTINDLGLKRTSTGSNRFDWGPNYSNEEFNMGLSSPFHSSGNMQVDMDL